MTANRIDNQNPAELAKQGLLPPVDDETKRATVVNQLMNRATAQTASASSTTSTTSTNGAVGATVVRAGAVNTVASKNSTQANLGPVTAPHVTIDGETATNAQNFASNVDKVMTNHLTAMSSAITSLQKTNPSVQFVASTPSSDAITMRGFNSGAIFMHGTSTGLARTVTAANADDGILVDKGSGALANASELQKRIMVIDMSTLSSDQLLAEFLKLNINDPNSNVQTQDKLYEVASQMREQELENAKKKIENAEQMMKDAQKYADQVESYAKTMSVVGIAAALLGPLGSILTGIMQIVMAVAQYTAQMKMEDAKQEMNNAQRFNLMADMDQNQIQETTDTINTIMENKNQMVDAVIQMLTAKNTTQQALMSAAMAR